MSFRSVRLLQALYSSFASVGSSYRTISVVPLFTMSDLIANSAVRVLKHLSAPGTCILVVPTPIVTSLCGFVYPASIYYHITLPVASDVFTDHLRGPHFTSVWFPLHCPSGR